MNNLFKCHSVHILPCSYFFILAVIYKYVIYTGVVCLLICRLHLHSSYQTFTPPPSRWEGTHWSVAWIVAESGS